MFLHRQDGLYDKFRLMKGILVFIASLFFLDSFACDTLKVRECRTFDSTDSTTLIAKYKSGKRHGLWKLRTYDGVILEKRKYKNGKLRYIFYYQNGELIKTENHNGEIRYPKKCKC